MSLRIRRGTNTERSGIVFDLAELAWTSDTKKLFVGDGITAGGNNILSTSAGAGLVFDSANGGVLKFDLSYLNAAIEAETFSLFDNQTHTGITFTHSNGVITAAVQPSEANELEIRNLVNSMLDTELTVSNDPTVDLNYLYNENTGVIQTSLVGDRVKFYAESLFTSEAATHTNITFTYDETDNVINASISDTTIKNLSASLLTDNELHTNISFTYAEELLTATVSGVMLEDNPILQANLDLNNYSLVGNGKIAINGALSLTAQSSPPENPQIGEIAIADGGIETGWNPLESLTDSNYPVYYDGSNWLHLGDYQQKAVFYVDSLRTDGYVPSGTIIKPFTTISDAITASVNSGLNIFLPTYIILLNSIIEDVVLAENNIFLNSFISSDSSSAPTIYGSVTINASNGSISPYNKFSISNIRIDSTGKDNAIVFEGTNSQLLNLNNVFINGITTGSAISLVNSGLTSIVNIDGCTFNVTSTSVIDLQTGILNLHNSNIDNNRVDSSGIILNDNVVTIINSHFNIIESSVTRVIEGQSGTVNYSKLSFNTNSNRKISSLINLTEFNNTFDVIRPTYNITPNDTSVSEGDTVTFTVSTTEVIDDTTLYWTTLGDVVAADFSDNQISGSFDINSSSGTITRIISEDALTEGSESFRIELRTGSISGPVVSTSELVNINDTSTSPPTYSIVPDTISVSEGDTVTFTVSTTEVLDDTTLYWTTLGDVVAADFSDNEISGSFDINSSSGTITRIISEDALTEGSESFRIELRTGSISGPVVSTSELVNINDTSTSPPTYSIVPDTISVSEGGIAAFDITTTNVPDGTILYWSLSSTSTATASDFVENISSGSIVPILSGITSFSLTVSEDITTEGPETFSIELRTGSETGPIVDTSEVITISDTSLTP